MDGNKRRKLIDGKVGQIKALVDAHAQVPLTAGQVEVLLQELDQHKVKLAEAHEELFLVCIDDAATKLQEDTTAKVEEAIRQVMFTLHDIKLAFPQPAPRIPARTAPDVKLPRMDLPTFSGNHIEWPSFHDLFNSMVHINKSISKSQKLHYLKNALHGEASQLVKSIDITDANYDRAWQLLIDRFNNKRHIVHSHIRALHKQEAMRSESSSGLRKLLDTTTKHLDAIQALGTPTADWEQIIVMIVDRLDPESRKQWELASPGSDLPDYDDLTKFLDSRARALEACEQVAPVRRPPQQQPPFQPKQPWIKKASASHHSSSSSATQKCHACNGQHFLFTCTSFVNSTAFERKNLVQKHNLCFNCLAVGHSAPQCTSKYSCRKCNARHHTMLHFEGNATSKDCSPDQGTPKTSSHFGISSVRSVLSTAIVNVKDSAGRTINCRALLDNGSELSFISEAALQLLGVKRHKSDLHVTGIGGEVSGRSRGLVKVELGSNNSSFMINANLHILTKLSGYLPQEYIAQDWSHLQAYTLADPGFFKPGKVDILIGADLYYNLLKDRTIQISGQPAIYETYFGWIVSGSISSSNTQRVSSHLSTVNIQSQLAKFWEMEEVQGEQHLTPEEVDCENHFLTTHQRDQTGRYVVALPFAKKKLELGASKEQAIRRLQQVERRLAKNPQHRTEYNKFMTEYLSLGHMEEIPSHQQTEKIGECFYLPHHFVLKETSTSTKFRVVFDGSAKSTTQVSLNDKLLIGPRLQRDIFDILVRFRFYKYGMMADISKFFRQIMVREQDRDFQRILWRDNTQQHIQEYRLTTVTYGTASAPYLASRALMRLADDCKDEFPLASEVVKRDCYVDDVMTGEHSDDAALELQRQLIHLLENGQFPLVKWVSNCPSVLEAVPAEQRETQLPLLLDSEDAVKALGMYWNPAADYFFYKVNLDKEIKLVTKRTLLSDTAKLYDPLGLLSPVLIRAKLLFQSLWKENLGWDDPLPPALKSEWLTLREDLFGLEALQIQRHIINEKDGDHQLHVFCDASQKAYSAVVYMRSEDSSGQVKTRIVCAKTKVAPVKIVSIPRLELCGSVLVSKLLNRVAKMLNIQISSMHAWTDSTVVLDWLNDHPGKWKTFVANRVADIQGYFPRSHWNHVPTKENPADCATKGLTSAELLDHDLWWFGPHWLCKSKEYWPPVYQSTGRSGLFLEQKSTIALTMQIQDVNLDRRFSSLAQLKRVTAFCLRFINNCRKDMQKRKGPLTPQELEIAFLYWVKQAQLHSFGTIMEQVKSGKHSSKHLASLQPFLDTDGLLRVGGRLEHSRLPYSHKHPLLLPQRHPFTSLVIRSEHQRLLHGGGQLVQASLSSRFWIINARKTIQGIIRRCVKCFRFNADTMTQIMGNLPSSRLESGKPFRKTGVDYGGPFWLKTMAGRGGKTYKSYLALFVCFSTKAIHLELVTDLTTDAFLAAFRRFVARRGKPLEMSSDNGTNFVGAKNELKELFDAFNQENHNHAVADQLATQGIKWNWIPPRAPHCGGLWEAGIKSAKSHMRKVIGDIPMTYEEMLTSLTQIEACLNSRPLCPMSPDPNDFEVLTPGHFLVGEPLMSIPEPGLLDLPQNRLSRFQLVQRHLQHFWKRWHMEYLQTLQQRSKWTQPGFEINIGDVVLIKEDNLPPAKWIMGRVIEKFPGQDGVTRKVNLKTSTGELTRHLQKLCRLPLDSVEDNSSRLGVCLGVTSHELS